LAIENLEPRSLLSAGAIGPASIISTAAGNGSPGYSGNPAPATAAALDDPADVAVDTAGDLFIADVLNYRIREVNHATGVITTIAGNGIKESSNVANGDGMAALQARIAPTGGIVVDAAGDVFFAEAGMNRVREIKAATGIITTYAGNGHGTNGYLDQLHGLPAATAVGVQDPSGLAIDAAGDLFIAEYLVNGNSDVREVHTVNNSPTPVLTTVAGVSYDAPTPAFNGQATTQFLYGPRGLALDGSGNLFIADAGDEFINAPSGVIRKVNLATGAISTVAGSGTTGFTADSVAANAFDLNNPVALAADAAGHLFIAVDSYFRGTAPAPVTYNDNRVLELSLSTSTITTIAGQYTGNAAAATTGGDNGPASAAVLNGPSGLALDAAGDLYIADSGNNRVRRVSAAASSVAALPAPAFTLATPASSTIFAGQIVTFRWTAANVDASGPSKISLGYDPHATVFDAAEHWIEINEITAANGASSYNWNTTGLAPGTYYLDGDLYDLSTHQTVDAHVGTAIVVAPPSFALAAPAARSVGPGQIVTLEWTVTGVDVAASAKISLGYDRDSTPFDANQHWIEVDQIAVTTANGVASLRWNTTGVAPGTYYLDGYLYDVATKEMVYSSLATPIVIT
jgi:hypothetical protein